MSNIAEALAKAKERTGTTTAPFLLPTASRPVTPPKDDTALRNARNKQRAWIGLLSIALLGTAFVLIEGLSADGKYAMPGAAVQTAARAPDRARDEAPSDASTPALAPGDLPEPRADHYGTVNSWVFTAVLPGEKPRLLFQGRVINTGEAVDGQLTFVGIRGDLLEFADRRGASYTLRY